MKDIGIERRQVLRLYEQMEGEEETADHCIIDRQNAQCPVAVECREIIWPVSCRPQPPGNEKAREDEKKIHARPAREDRLG